MDVTGMFEAMFSTIGENLPGIVGALLILIIGWILAVVIRAGIRKMLVWARLNERVLRGTEKKVDFEGGIAKAVYYILLVLVFIAFFDKLNLELVAGPLRALADEIFGYAPKLIAGTALLLVAWILASFLRGVASTLLGRTQVDEKLSREAGMKPMSETIGHILYWLVFLLFLPAVLGALELRGLLNPVEEMVGELFGIVPNLFAAVLIVLAGWFLARILRDLASNLLAAAGADSLGGKIGLRGTMTFSRLIGLVLYVVILVPVIVAALDSLGIESISEPAVRMLDALMGSIPHIFAAALIVLISYIVLRFVSEIVAKVLGGMGFDRLPAKIGLGESFLAAPTASQVVGRLVLFFGMLFATVEAAHRLGFDRVSELVEMFIEFGAQVLLGLLILGIGLWIAKIVHAALIATGGKNARALAGLARVAIVGFVIAMGLRAMDVADQIVNLAFGLTLGAIAVAVALAFGLGGREAAGRQLEDWFRKMRGE
ncbi:MAG: mechanosensitive ion channel [Candidatus Eisenbacteria bacterium]